MGVWPPDLGDMQTKHGHGEGSSPALHGDTVVVNWDHEGESFRDRVDKTTGEGRWKVARDEVTSWASPIVVEHDGKAQVVVSGTTRVRGYDLANGDVIWECGGLSLNVVATPVAAGGMVYAGSSYEKQAFVAIPSRGRHRRHLPDEEPRLVPPAQHTLRAVPPALRRVPVLLHHYQGFLSRVDAKTGTEAHRPLPDRRHG